MQQPLQRVGSTTVSHTLHKDTSQGQAASNQLLWGLVFFRWFKKCFDGKVRKYLSTSGVCHQVFAVEEINMNPGVVCKYGIKM